MYRVSKKMVIKTEILLTAFVTFDKVYLTTFFSTPYTLPVEIQQLIPNDLEINIRYYIQQRNTQTPPQFSLVRISHN